MAKEKSFQYGEENLTLKKGVMNFFKKEKKYGLKGIF